MSLTVRIPAPLRARAGGARIVQLEATSLAELRRALAEGYPDLGAAVLDGQAFASAISVFVDGEDVRFLPEDADLRNAHLVELLPAMSGG